MFQKHPITPDYALFCGIILVVTSVIFICLVLFRFQWLLGFAFARELLRWGRGRCSYPASKLGAFTSCILGLTFGSALIDQYFTFLPQRVWAFVCLVELPFAAGVALRDYRLHRRRAKKTEEANDLN